MNERIVTGRTPLLRPALLLALTLSAFGLTAAALHAAEAPAKPAKPPAPKPYEILRFREDYAALRCKPVGQRCDWGDRLKALPLGPCLWLDVGGQVRLRYEHFENFAFRADDPADDGWLLARVRAHANLVWGDHVRLFAEGIWAEQEERTLGPRPIDENHGDLLNLFLDVGGHVGCVDLGLRVGRQELLFDRQRLVGPVDWSNTRRTFEGASAWAKTKTWRVDAFYARPVLVAVDDFDESDDATDFAGLHYANTSCKDSPWALYAYYLERDAATYQGVTAAEERFTVGAAAWGPIGGSRLDYDVEAAVQAGTFGAGDVAAWMLSAELGWKPCNVCWEPRIALGFDVASGDDDGPGGDLGTFHQLFPTGHLWFGWADLVGRQNVLAGRLTVTAKPAKKLTLRADLHVMERLEASDDAYNAAGAVLRAAGGSAATGIATEADLVAKLAVSRHLDLEAGYAHVFAGDFIEATGAAEDVDFLYASLTFTF